MVPVPPGRPVHRGARVLVALMVLSTLGVTLPAVGLAANGVTREAGSNRYQTSVIISRRHFGPGVNAVYIVNGSTASLPYALLAGPAAAKLGGPVLLVHQDSIPKVVRTELDRLNPGKIIVVGGANQVSGRVRTRLGSYTTGNVSREAGTGRYSTGVVISRRHFDPGVDAVYIVNGSAGLRHAMAAGPAAAKLGGPILLVHKDSIPTIVRGELDRLNPGRIIVIGSSALVSSRVKSRLGNFTTGHVSREAGSSPYGTSSVISRRHFSPGVNVVYIVNGLTGLRQALLAGPAAAKLGGPILLVHQDSISNSVAAELDRLSPDRIIIVGSSAYVSAHVMNLLEGYVAPPPNQAPVAVDDSFGTLVTGCGWQTRVLANDTDADDDTTLLSVTDVSDPAHGTAAILQTRVAGIVAPRVVRYTSDPGYTGADSFTYTVSDPHGATDVGLLSVSVAASTADDDADGVADACDPFAADGSNETGATLPFTLIFNGGDGGLVDSGFVGVMTNSRIASLDLLDGDVGLDGLGALVNPTVDGGDAIRGSNDQRNALQANLEMPSDSFTVHGLVCEPYPTEQYASTGIYFGTGDQDNYIKVVISWNASHDALQVHDVREANGYGAGIGRKIDAALAADSCIDLYLTVNKAAGTYAPSYSLDGGAHHKGLGGLSSRRTVPASWLEDSAQLAAGIIATSNGPSPEIEAKWKRFEVTQP
jgi:putative cell wall-binding protein